MKMTDRIALKILLTTICPGNADIQLALYYLKTYFAKHSAKSNLININILSFSSDEKLHSMVNQLTKYKPDIIGFASYVWNITNILKVARLIKENMPATRIVLGGPEVSPRAKNILKNYRFVDVVVIGGGEETFKELLEHWLTNSDSISKVKGIAYHRKNRIIITDKRPQISNLDDIPSPYLEKTIDIDLKSYQGYIPTETMRGCVYKCHYCYYYKDFGGMRYFSLPRVEKELKYLLEKKPAGIYLMDATFNAHKKRAKEVLKVFIKYNKKTKLHVELKAELLDREMVDLLYKAKAKFIEIGVQSTNKKTLRLINRIFKPGSFKKNIRLLNKKKIPYELQLIDGLPGDNYNTLKQSLDELFMLKPFSIKIMRFMLLPGTYLRQHAKDFGIRYNTRPPYYTKESNTFSFEDIKKAQVLRTAMSMCYDGGLLRNSLYLINKKLGIGFSEILEEWDERIHKEHNWVIRKIKGISGGDGKMHYLMNKLAFRKIANLSTDFVEFLYKKYHKPFADKRLLKFIQRDRRIFLKGQGIKEEKI